jgi:phage tail tape-measure protein
MAGKAFGEQSPLSGEDAVSWQTWTNGAGTVPTIYGDADWGKLILDLSGEEGRSAVYDLGDTAARTFTITANRYGAGYENAVYQIRGASGTFTQDGSVPVWEEYSGTISRNWRFVQAGVTTSGTFDQFSGTVTVE